ncbi:MAG TPA: hypothetical protein DCG75_18210 [Bacteroidales bacterium]|nr:hypothetical protein [Bacteroidales bacterium]
MRKLTGYFLIISLLLSVNIAFAQGSAEDAAKDIIKAYKTKDPVLLKKYVAGFFAMAINESFFDSDDGKPLVEIAGKWDGSIKEIRYSKGDMMGKSVLLASAYFSDNPNGNLNVVILSSYENSDWKAFALGISDISKSEFEEGSIDIPGDAKAEETKPSACDYAEFSIEMASGDTYEKPGIDKLKELLKSLNDDNFFLILTSNDGFLQTTTSEKGYIVQYSDDSGMFEAESIFTLEKVTDIFVLYMNKGEWKSKAKWNNM